MTAKLVCDDSVKKLVSRWVWTENPCGLWDTPVGTAAWQATWIKAHTHVAGIKKYVHLTANFSQSFLNHSLNGLHPLYVKAPIADWSEFAVSHTGGSYWMTLLHYAASMELVAHSSFAASDNHKRAPCSWGTVESISRGSRYHRKHVFLLLLRHQIVLC